MISRSRAVIPALNKKSCPHQLCKRISDTRTVITDLLFQQPPPHNTFQGILRIRMLLQIRKDGAGNFVFLLWMIVVVHSALSLRLSKVHATGGASQQKRRIFCESGKNEERSHFQGSPSDYLKAPRFVSGPHDLLFLSWLLALRKCDPAKTSDSSVGYFCHIAAEKCPI